MGVILVLPQPRMLATPLPGHPGAKGPTGLTVQTIQRAEGPRDPQVVVPVGDPQSLCADRTELWEDPGGRGGGLVGLWGDTNPWTVFTRSHQATCSPSQEHHPFSGGDRCPGVGPDSPVVSAQSTAPASPGLGRPRS